MSGRRVGVPAEAEVVRRVFRDFPAGIPGPDGKLWTDSTLTPAARSNTRGA